MKVGCLLGVGIGWGFWPITNVGIVVERGGVDKGCAPS